MRINLGAFKIRIAVDFTKRYHVDLPLRQTYRQPIGCNLPHKCVGVPFKSALQW